MEVPNGSPEGGRRLGAGVERFKAAADPATAALVDRLESLLLRLSGNGSVPLARQCGLGANFPKRTNRLHSAAAEQASDDRKLLEAWVGRMRAQGCSPEAILALFVGGASFVSVDRGWSHRNGWARAQLARAIDLFSEVLCRPT